MPISPEITERVARVLQQVVQGDMFQTFMRNSGFNVTWEPPAEFENTMRDTDTRLGRLMTGETLSIQPMWFGPMFFPAVLGGLLALVVLGLLLASPAWALSAGGDLTEFANPEEARAFGWSSSGGAPVEVVGDATAGPWRPRPRTGRRRSGRRWPRPVAP